MTSLELPRSLTTIDEEAFMGTSVNVVSLQGRVETIGPRAFANSPSLMSVNLPKSLTTIDPSAFDADVILVAQTESLFFWALDNGFNNVLYIP